MPKWYVYFVFAITPPPSPKPELPAITNGYNSRHSNPVGRIVTDMSAFTAAVASGYTFTGEDWAEEKD